MAKVGLTEKVDKLKIFQITSFSIIFLTINPHFQKHTQLPEYHLKEISK
jgi:hypothetical protein